MSAPYEIKDKAERVKAIMECKRNLLKIDSDPSIKWKMVKEEGAIQVFKSEEQYQKSGQRICKTLFTVDKPCDATHRLMDMRYQYRNKWDQLLESKVEMLEDFGECVYLTRHLTAKALKGVVSARENIDVAYIGPDTLPDGTKCYVHAILTLDEDFKNYPASPGRVRIRNYCTGFIISPVENEPNKTRVSVVVCTDLNMNSIGAMMSEWVKPTLMLNQCHQLQEFVAQNPQEPSDL